MMNEMQEDFAKRAAQIRNLDNPAEICNAQIIKTSLGREDHGTMCFWLTLDFGGSCQGFGGYGLDYHDCEKDKQVYSDKGLEAISKILDVAGVDTWEELEGKYVRVIKTGFNSRLDVIGHIIKDEWFNIRKHFEEKDETNKTNN